MAGKFLFEVGTSFDTGSVDAAVAHYKRAIAEVAAGGAVQAPAQLAEVRRAASSTLATFREGGADEAAVVAARQQITRALRATAAALQASLGDLAQLGQAEREAAAALKKVASSAVYSVGLPQVSSLPAAGEQLAKVREQTFASRTPNQVLAGGRSAEERAAAAEKLAMARLGLDEIAGETAEARQARIAVARRAEVERLRAANAQRLLAGEGDDVGPRSQRIAAERVLAEQGRLQRIQQARAAESQEAQLIVQRMVEQRSLNRELNRRVATEIENRRLSGEAGFQGSLFQRLQASTASRGGQPSRLPEEFATLGQFVTSKALTTAGFAVSGAALYGGVTLIKEALQETTKLQTSLAGIEAQFVATDRSAQFPEFRRALLETARDTRTLGSEVASLAPLFVGAFGEGERAAKELRSAVVGIKTGAFTKADAANISVALSSTFGLSVQEITDQGLHLQDVFGVASQEILRGVADLGPVAKETGLTFKEASTLIAAATQATGRPATAISEALGRVLPELNKQAFEIVEIYRSIPALAPKADQITDLFASGDTGRVVVELVKDSKELDAIQKARLITAVGQRREAAAVTATLQQEALANRELRDETDQTGLTQERFERIMESVGERLGQVGEMFRQIGQDLLRAGLGGFLSDVALIGGGVVSLLGGLVKVLANLNELTQGWAARLLEVVIALRLVQALVKSNILAGALSAITGARAVTTTAATAGAELGGLGLGAGAGAAGARAAAGVGASRGLGAAALGLVGGPWGLAVTVGSVLALSQLSHQQDKARQEAQKLGADLEKADRATLEAAARQHRKGLDAIIHDVFIREPDQGEIARQILAKQDNVPLAGDLSALGAAKSLPRATVEERDRAIKNLQGYDSASPPSASLPKPASHAAAVELLKRAVGRDTATYDELIEGIKQGQEAAIAAGRALIEELSKRPGFNPDLAAARTDLANKDATVKALESLNTGANLLSAQEAVAAYQAGDKSLGETLAKLDELVAFDRKLAESPGATKEHRDRFAQELKLQSETWSKALRAGADLRLQLGDVGGQAGPEAAIAEYTKLLQNPQFTSQTERVKAAFDLAKAQQEMLKKMADAAPAGAERAAVYLRGLESSTDVRAVFNSAQVDLNPSIQGFFSQFIVGINGMREGFSQKIGMLVALGQSFDQAIRSLLEDTKARLVGQLFTGLFSGHTNETVAELQKVQKALDNIPAGLGADVTPAPDRVTSPGAAAAEEEKAADKTKEIAAARRALARARAHGDPVAIAQNELAAANEELAEATDPAESMAAQARVIESQDALTDAYNDIARARLARAKAQAGGDPLAEAGVAQQEARLAARTAKGQAARLAAQAQGVEAERARQDAQNAIRQAGFGVTRAQIGDDPIRQARLAQLEAAHAARTARSTADRLAAEAARIDADRSMQSAVADLFNSQVELAIAVANAAGDTLKAARLGAQESRDKLNQARSAGAGKAELNRLEADVVRANAEVVSTQVSTQERNIDFALQMGQITASQAVAQLQGLLNLVAGNEAETQRILLKIHELKNSLNQDLQFNIPEQIHLPTLYEARRLNQSPGGYQDNRPGAGLGYQDNRNINIVLQVDANTDYNAAYDTIQGMALEPASRYGTRGSLYSGA